ncbi:MAG: cystathionine beta-lyase [Burkholderiaceae bacterium]
MPEPSPDAADKPEAARAPSAPPSALATRVTSAGRVFDDAIRTANLPVHRASTVLFDSLAQAEVAGRDATVGMHHASSYGTAGTATTMALMDALAEIEGGGHACRAALMPSGLAAITTALFAFLKPGDHLLMPDAVYGPARTFATGMLARYGVVTTFYDAGEPLEPLLRDTTRVIYLESPGSYTFEIQDVPAICALARSRGIMTMIDNAWASPVFARPFDWGVDASILPLTKYWSGHSDVLMGAVVIRDALWPTLWTAVRQLGLCVGGDDAWLILRGLRTAEVRMRQHERSALQIAQWLAQRPEVSRVLHPALPGFPSHALWKRDFNGSSGLFSFELAPGVLADDPPRRAAQLAALCEGRRHFGIGYSWGGFESLIMPAKIAALRTARPWTGGQLIRVHSGLESPQDLIADLAQGLEALTAAIDR